MNWDYGREVPFAFMIHVLDNENTVLDVDQMNTLSRKACDDRIEKISRILKNGHRIYVAGIGDLYSL